MSPGTRELFLQAGASVETIAHLRGISKNEVILVEDGVVDLFLCQMDAEGKTTRREFLMQAGPEPTFIFGLETADDFALMAATLGNVEVAVLPEQAMVELLKTHPEDMKAPVLAWHRRFSERAVDHPLPILARAISPGEIVEAKAVDRFYPRHPVFVELKKGTVSFVDARPVEQQGALVPLLPTTWLTTNKDTVFKVLEYTQALAHERGWGSLKTYGQAIVKLVVANRKELSKLETTRIRDRAAVDAKTHGQGWKQMARVLSHEKLEAVHQVTAAEPLLACMEKVGKSLGVPVVPSPRASANDPLDDICRASNLRVRRVNLRSNWWKLDAGPLVGWLKDDGRPVALIPPRPGAYLLQDPSDGSSVKVNAEVAERLKSRGAMFYRRLPDRAIGLKELFSLALLGSRRDLIAMLVMGAAVGTTALAIPVGTKLLFDTILPLGDRSYLFELMWGLLLIAICNICFLFSYSVALIRFGGRFGSDLTGSMFDRLLTLPMPFFRKYAIGDLAQRALGVTQVRDLVTGGTLTKVISSIFGLISYLLLLVYDLRLALLAGCLLAINLIFSTRTGLQQLYLRRKAADVSGQVNGILYQILGGLPKLRVAGAESRFFAYWAERFSRQMDYEYRAGNLAALVAVFNTAFPVASTFLLFSFVGLTRDPIATGTLLGFLAAFAQCTVAIAALSDSAAEISAALPQLERTAPILAAVPEKDEQKIDPGELSGAIELSNVCFRYRTDQPPILNKVSIKVEPREFVALVGGTGAGKSTVLNLLLGFDQPESGSVFYDRKDLSMLDLQAVRQQIGVVLQSGRIIKDTVYRNIASGRPISLEQTWEALRMVNLDSDVEAMPMGLDTVISPETFSGGQAQRLLVARAIVSRPRIIFFDEATSALDNRTQAVVSSSLEHLNAARVVIAHRLSTIRGADRIYVMSAGEVVQVGNFEELSAQPGLFAELMARQQEHH